MFGITIKNDACARIKRFPFSCLVYQNVQWLEVTTVEYIGVLTK